MINLSIGSENFALSLCVYLVSFCKSSHIKPLCFAINLFRVHAVIQDSILELQEELTILQRMKGLTSDERGMLP